MLMVIFLLARIVASAHVASGNAAKQLRDRHSGSSFISSLEFKHTLRVCNAYPYKFPMDIYLGKEKLTDSPMPYKKCGEFTPPLKAGDKLDFRVGDSSAGSFSVSELPGNNAVMLLVIYRHDTLSTAVSFESHVFSNLVNSQIAVLDAYRGKADSKPRIQDVNDAKTQRNEELRYDSVVAVNPGLYEVVLGTADGGSKARHQLVALNRESYVIVRCGVEAEQGQSYPQDLIVFPNSDAKVLEGAAHTKSVFLAAVLAVAAAAWGA
jgi:hypothetical protein